ncbi:MAG: hypothetical protein MI742_10975 [Desulfobacterales bacterium]|nr:hypothetical protein [Desulfobacterales bacterium]
MPTVQFLGYQLKTAQPLQNKNRYLGYNNPAIDIETRCRIFADAALASSRHTSISPLATKIFVAPEFFFRGGSGGAYTLEQIASINAILDNYLAHPSFRNWIFFLGTAVGALPGQSGNESEIFNVALVRKGGVRVANGLERDTTLSQSKEDAVLIYKEYISEIDFLGENYGKLAQFHQGIRGKQAVLQGQTTLLKQVAGSRPGGNPDEAFRRTRQGLPAVSPLSDPSSEQSRSGLGGGSIFEMGGLRFVTEICLDHRYNRALDANPPNIDIHIVISCGMQPQYAITRSGGYLFSVDGFEFDPFNKVYLFKSQNRQVTPLKMGRYILMTDPKNWVHYKQDGKALFANGRGAVSISPPQPLH